LTRDLRLRLAELFPEYATSDGNGGDIVELKVIWRVWDTIQRAAAESVCQPLCEVSPGHDELMDRILQLDVESFREIEDSAKAVEKMKFTTGDAGAMLASNLLWLILERIVDTNANLFVYSATTPIMMGLLGAMNEDLAALDGPIDFASAIIAEVYEDAEEHAYVRFLFKPEVEVAPRYLELKNAGCHDPYAPPTLDGGEFCRVDDVIDWAKSNTYESYEDWCQACENESSDVCMSALLARESTPSTASSVSSASSDADAEAEAAEAGSPGTVEYVFVPQETPSQPQEKSKKGGTFGMFALGTFVGAVVMATWNYRARLHIRRQARAKNMIYNERTDEVSEVYDLTDLELDSVGLPPGEGAISGRGAMLAGMVPA